MAEHDVEEVEAEAFEGVGDITREEYQEFVLHFAYYAGWPRASALDMAF